MNRNTNLQKLQLIFNKIYQSRFKIGQTPTAKIFLGINTSDDDKQIAIKLEKTSPENKLEHQAKIYKILHEAVGVPKLYWFGREHDHDVLVTDLLGPSLEHLFTYCDDKFSLKTVIMIADQLLDRLEYIHEKEFVYRDIKPANFLVGLGSKADKIYIIDFQLTRKYVDLDGTHKRLKEAPAGVVYGNELFLSIHGHLGLEQSRRDDLESLGYMLVYFLKGYLPWQNLIAEDVNKRNLMVKQKKISIPVQLLCENLPKQFEKYFDYVKALEFQEEPDYLWLKRLFKDLSVEAGQKLNLIFDWAQKHHLQKN